MKIKIEDYYGNDLCSFVVYNNNQYYDDDVEIENESLKDCNIADKDIDENGHEYVRIQMDTRIKAGKL